MKQGTHENILVDIKSLLVEIMIAEKKTKKYKNMSLLNSYSINVCCILDTTETITIFSKYYGIV